MSSLSLDHSTLNLPVVAASTNIFVGSLATGGTTNVINISAVPVFPGYPVQITLIKYSGSIGGSGFDFGLGTAPPLVAGYMSNNIANASVDLVMTSGPAGVETWTGSANGNWDTGSQNWLAGGNPATYANGDSVQFLDGAHTSTVNLTTTLLPNSITVSNASPSYTFNGSGQITGATGLPNKAPAHCWLTIAGAIISQAVSPSAAGALQVGNNDASGNLPSGAITDNGLLVFARTDTPTIRQYHFRFGRAGASGRWRYAPVERRQQLQRSGGRDQWQHLEARQQFRCRDRHQQSDYRQRFDARCERLHGDQAHYRVRHGRGRQWSDY